MSDSDRGSRNLLDSFGLQTRLMVGLLFLIVLCMGAAILATAIYGKRVAQESIDSALSQSQSVQARFAQLQLEQLALQASWFARDPNIVSYFQESVDTNSTVSLLDLLAEYQQEVQFDVALVLDADGFLVARTDDPEAVPTDLAGEPLVEMAFDEGSASGFWLDGGVLHTAVAVPLTQQFDLIGYLIMARELNLDFAAEVKRLSSADIAYLIEVNGGLRVAATTLNGPEEERLLGVVRSKGGLASVLQGTGDIELQLGDEPYIGLAVPIRDAYSEILGASVALTSEQERTEGLSRLLRLLYGVGFLSLLLGFGLAFALSRRLLQPLRNLVDVSEAAREGKYDVDFGTGGSDEVGRLSRSFDALLHQLHSQRELQTFVGQLSRNLPDAGEAPALLGESANLTVAAVGAIDLRDVFSDGGMDIAEKLVARLEADIRTVHQYCSLHDGQLITILGHRLYVAFEDAQGPSSALLAISDALAALATPVSSFEDPRPRIAALTVGKVLVGPLKVGARRQLSVAGSTVQELEGLLRESAPGDFVLSRRFRSKVSADLDSARVELEERDSLLSTQTHFLVDPVALSTDFRAALKETESGSVHESKTQDISSGEALTPVSGHRPLTHLPLLEPGSVVGDRFEILSILGKGGMGVVYKARDRELEDLVALKALLPSVIRNDTQGEETIEQLKAELKLARKVTHPHVVRTHDFFMFEGSPFISMEYVRGITLRYMMDRSGGVPRAAAVNLLQQLCAGLGAAHSQQVLHGDIKPENIILEADGHAKLMDFGIATPLWAIRGDSDRILGTPYYMAPEQITGEDTDVRSDIYACGVVAYELLVGRLPFTGATAKEVCKKHISEDPPTPSELVPNLPARLEAVLLRCLAKNPSERYSSAEELERDLSP